MKDFCDHSDWLEAKVKLQISAAISFRKRCLADLNRRKNEKKGGNSKMGEWLQREKECRKGTRPKTKRERL